MLPTARIGALPLDPPIWTIALLLALLLGSFLNVCIARLPQHRSIARPASHCPLCGAPVRARDNIPVLSWLLLRGRCRDCGLPIAPRYPLVELGYTLLVTASLVKFGLTIEGAAASVFCFLVLGLLVMDLETMLLPDAFTLPGLAAGLVWSFLQTRNQSHRLGWVQASSLLAPVVWTLLLLAIRWLYFRVRRRQGLGLGDVKLVAMLAAWLGFGQMTMCFLIAVLAASAAAGIFAMVQRPPSVPATQEPAWRTMQLPLGAFLCGSALLTLFFGEQILSWYLSFYR